MRGVEKVVIMRHIAGGGGGGGGFVVRLNVGDEVVDGRIQMLSRKVEVHRWDALKVCGWGGGGEERGAVDKL